MISNLSNGLEVAVIGMSGQFPGAKNVSEFWQNLCDGRESVSFFSDAELAASGISQKQLADRSYIKARATLDDIEFFDAAFFGLTPREAELMDPQHRLFLECAWSALEIAGYSSDKYANQIGIYAGAGINTYYLLNVHSNPSVIASAGVLQTNIGNEKDHLTTFTSYKLNLGGPSLTVQTTCSTSLVAIHMACKSLIGGECDLALAGGVSISVPQKAGYLYQEGGIFSPDGHCRAFDSRSQGTVMGSGVGIVVLKRLEDALVDGDHIHAVIKGTAVNNDGSLKTGYTAPSIEGQARVIRMAHAVAEIEPDTITYIETHGTGTALGDPIEINALTKVFRARTERKGFCAIGSVKTNIGHLDAAAGVAGFIKTVLALEHKQLPPSLHFEQANPYINFNESPFYVNTMHCEWPAGDTPRRAGISAFGIGGTNAHIVIEEAPACESASGPEQQLLVISAKTSSALETATENLIEYLKSNPKSSLGDIAYSLQVGRRRFAHRRTLVCRDQDDAVRALGERDPRRVSTLFQDDTAPPLMFMFPGQGSQYVNMCVGLYRDVAAFRTEVDNCAQLLEEELGLDLRDVLYPHPSRTAAAAERFRQSSIAQVALFVTEYALANVWKKWGVVPQAVIGHSLGEYVAACLAGVFSLEDALRIVVVRARLMQLLPPSEMVTPVSERFAEEVAKIRLSTPRIPFLSNVTGHWLSESEVTCPSYWAAQLHQPVRFAEGIAELLKEPRCVLLEVGPGQALCSLALQQQTPATTEQIFLPSLPQSQENCSDTEALLNTLGKLWRVGVEVDWFGVHAGEHHRRVPLPTYPFERRRYWIEPAAHPTEQRLAISTGDQMSLAQTLGNGEAHATPEVEESVADLFKQTEQAVVNLWKELFGLEQIGLEDDFFNLGGNSLLAIQLATRLRQTLQIKLPMSDLIMENPTVAELVKVIMTKRLNVRLAEIEEQLNDVEMAEIDTLMDDLQDLPPEQLQAMLTSHSHLRAEDEKR